MSMQNIQKANYKLSIQEFLQREIKEVEYFDGIKLSKQLKELAKQSSVKPLKSKRSVKKTKVRSRRNNV